jgi:hypothetical protein
MDAAATLIGPSRQKKTLIKSELDGMRRQLMADGETSRQDEAM